ncbi:MAG: hypothetical protein ACNA8W_11200, partial [Bradymonadaceae bacterium]
CGGGAHPIGWLGGILAGGLHPDRGRGSGAGNARVAAGQLAGASTFSGNTNDIVVISGVIDDSEIRMAVVWPNIDGADYLVRAPIVVTGEEATGHLTITEGATVAFDQNAGLVAYRGGILTARGTADLPIIFTGKENTAGYWKGLQFNTTNSTNNVLEHATIEYAGGPGWSSSYSGASPASILLNSWTGPVRVSINDVIIRGSGSVGLHLYENAGDINIEGCSNVTFEDNAGLDIEPADAGCPR